MRNNDNFYKINIFKTKKNKNKQKQKKCSFLFCEQILPYYSKVLSENKLN